MQGAAAGASGWPCGMSPGIGRPKGFQSFCMNEIASCGENGVDPPPGGLVESAVIVPPQFPLVIPLTRRAFSSKATPAAQ
jgi:hypothetical protein